MYCMSSAFQIEGCSQMYGIYSGKGLHHFGRSILQQLEPMHILLFADIIPNNTL